MGIFFRDHHFFNVIYIITLSIDIMYQVDIILAKHKRCPYLKCEYKAKFFMMLCCECLPQTCHRERFWFETLILFYLIMKLNVHYQSSHSYPNKPNMLYKINEIKIYNMIDVNKFTNMQLLLYTHINATDKFIMNTTKCDVICSTMK